MAIDTKIKRASVLNVGSFFPGRIPQPAEPDAGDLDDANQRGFILWHYAGIAASVITLTITCPDATWDGLGMPPMNRYVNISSSTNTITIQGATVDDIQQTINGSVSFTITSAYGWAKLISNGTNWMKFD